MKPKLLLFFIINSSIILYLWYKIDCSYEKYSNLMNEFSTMQKTNEQLEFKNNILIAIANQSEYKRNIYSKKPIIYLVIPENVCMECVNNELINNANNKSLIVRAMFKSDENYKDFTRRFSNFIIQRDTVMKFEHFNYPFYIFVDNNGIIDIYKPDLKSNELTNFFLKKYVSH